MARHRALRQPAVEVLGRVGGDARVRAAHRLVPQPGPVEPLQHLGREARAVVVEGQAGVAPVPRDVDVAHLVVERQAVGGQVRLEEAAVLLGLEPGRHGLDRLGEAPVDPGRELHDRPRLRVLEDEQVDDPLHPGGAALRVGRDHHVRRGGAGSGPSAGCR